jgi:pilus assembly protein CpaB
MRSRGLIIAIAFVLAGIATMVVYLYLLGVKRQSAGGELVTVVVSERDVPAGTDLDGLLSEGAITTRSVPRSALVHGAITEPSDLKGRETSAAVAAGEQITTGRLRGSQQLPGGALGIPDGYTALTLPLETPRVAGGLIQRSDHVTLYGTFTNIASSRGSSPASTVTLVADVQVLRVDKPAGESVGSGSNNDDQWVTFALKPHDAQRVVFAQEQGSVWMALLPPDQRGVSSRPVNATQMVR